MTLTTLPPHDEIKPNTPLRLEVAAALAFPDSSMTAFGLRRDGARGRLVMERVAGKDYPPVANIGRAATSVGPPDLRQAKQPLIT
jgi:hypothetical protein